MLKKITMVIVIFVIDVYVLVGVPVDVELLVDVLV